MSDDFLSRWSRRKRSGEAEEAPASEAADVAPEEFPSEGTEGTDDEILARHGLKHPDAMEPGEDFGAFLRAAVPLHLKTIALRRLWRSNPTLACLDGLNDYDGDYTGTGVPAGGLKTSYEVGRGFLKQIAEHALAEPADVAEAPAPDEDAGPDEKPAPTDDTQESEIVQMSESVQEIDTPRTTRRRMVFRTHG